MNKKKVLLICYSFPPFPGIGGRRWAKFSKYLTRRGFEIHVIGAEVREEKKSNWTNDVTNNPNLKYYPIRTKFHDFFHNHKMSLSGKIKYKLSKIYLENKFKGNFYDKSLASNELFYKKAKEIIIKEDIKNLLITIAPNRLVDVGVRLKKDFPDLNFIFDIRDPWNICLDEWDHKYLSNEQKAFELKSELTAVKIADKVFSVYKVVVDFYIKNVPEKKNDFIYVPNGFDREEIVLNSELPKPQEKKYFAYTGILYDTTIKMFEEFCESISLLHSEVPEVMDNYEFRFYSPEMDEFNKLIEKYKVASIVKFCKQVPLYEVHNIISRAEACVLFLPLNFEFSLSTKFYEYVAHEKKILVFSHEGEVTKLIREKNLGYALLPDKVFSPLKQVIVDFHSGKTLSKHNFDLENYSIEKLAEQLVPYFI